MHHELEEWPPLRAALLTAIGMWAGGFALAGASAWRMQHPTAGTGANDDVTPTLGNCDNQGTDAPDDSYESEGAVFMPGDVLVARRTPMTGVTVMQQP